MASFRVNVDVLNAPSALEVVQMAIDLCATAEQFLADPSPANLARLEEATKAFRAWFRG